MAKNDLFKKDWLDIVFAGRNKQYGAYKLRLESPRTTLLALGSGLCLFALVFVAPAAISSFFEDENEWAKGEIISCDFDFIDEPLELVDVVLPKIEEEVKPLVDESYIEEASAPASVVDVERFTNLEVASADEITEEVVKQTDLGDALIGSESIKGNAEGTILIKEKAGHKVDGGEEREGEEAERGNEIYRITTESAAPMEGLAAFSKSFITKFREIHMPDASGKVQVILSFVVEKDGSITDIKVLRDPGYGAGKEAVRVLKTMPKWKPARQDNRTVRSQFTLPITIQVQ
ncbi:energy transducer TonB [Myroides sp. DF42-4-2]|uniref:energy transducer TonB n=1 Tax=unclassified Myroides TaxID=2642485 RepID=UPI0025765914|nr:energy transducer TonB [Myroides sp. DF42-4-2]MDM1408441.1 energy transducer TonB [Myroides sp. DF42-4-2]